jgi:hypothetical protein
MLSVGLPAQTIQDSLLLYYEMDGNANDTSGNGYHGTLFGGPASITDRFGNPNSAYEFDLVDDYIELPNSASLKPPLPLTVSFWTKVPSLTQAGSHFFVTDDEPGDYNGVSMGFTADNQGNPIVSMGGGLGFTGVGNRRSLYADSALTVNTWHHITAVVRGPLDMDLYIDCADAGGAYDGSGPTTMSYSTYPGTIGRALNGALDEFAYWSRALSLAEVVTLCQGALGVAESGGRILIHLFPNPTASTITVSGLPSSEHTISLYDRLGQRVIESTSSSISTEGLSIGMYFLTIQDDSGRRICSKRVVKSF